MLKKISPLLALLCLLMANAAIATPPPQANAKFPLLNEQLKNAHVKSRQRAREADSDNQDFGKLRTATPTTRSSRPG